MGPVLSQVSSLLWPEYISMAKTILCILPPPGPAPGMVMLTGAALLTCSLQDPVTLNLACVGGVTWLGPA